MTLANQIRQLLGNRNNDELPVVILITCLVDELDEASSAVTALTAELEQVKSDLKVVKFFDKSDSLTEESVRNTAEIKRLKAELEQMRERVGRLETSVRGLLDAEYCIVCLDKGYHIGYDSEGDAMKIKCEFCYTEPNSMFNRKAEAQQALQAEEGK